MGVGGGGGGGGGDKKQKKLNHFTIKCEIKSPIEPFRMTCFKKKKKERNSLQIHSSCNLANRKAGPLQSHTLRSKTPIKSNEFFQLIVKIFLMKIENSQNLETH